MISGLVMSDFDIFRMTPGPDLVLVERASSMTITPKEYINGAWIETIAKLAASDAVP